MKPRLNATRAARELIKAYEPFLDTAERRGRRWVIGWGHRATAKEGATITPENAELLLIYDVLLAQQAVDAAVGGAAPKPARDALASFAASIGLSAFKVSDVARLAKAGRHREAAAALDSWVRTEEDGRLVVSDRLVERRRTEKTLYLEALEDAAEADAEPPAEEPTLGALVDVDIAFETEPATEAAPVVVSEAVTDEGDEPAEAVADPDVAELGEADSADAEVEPDPTDVDDAGAATFEALDTQALAEIEGAALLEDEPAADEAESQRQERKSQQDAAIQAVMARMAGEIASSAPPAAITEVEADAAEISEPSPAEEILDEDSHDAVAEASEEAAEQDEPVGFDLTDVRLGFSFLAPVQAEARIEAPAADEADAAPVPDPVPALEAAPETAPEPEVEAVEKTAAPAQALAPVFGTVSVGPVRAAPTAAVEPKPEPEPIAEPEPTHEPAPEPALEPAPPHPSMAPASAPGLSGESEGPDHDKDDEAETGEEDDILEPALVAGPEAVVSRSEPAKTSDGGWVYPAILAIGVGLTGLGGWELANHWDAYSNLGLEFSPLGPVVFGAGVLLAVGGGWFTFRRG